MKMFFTTIFLLTIVFIAKAQPGANDPTFNPVDIGFGTGDGFNGGVNSLVTQSDGKIIVGGTFTTYNGTNQSCVVRLNTDGSIDSTFNIGYGFSYIVYTLAIQSDGKVIVGGNFNIFNGNGRNNLARLNTDGSLDTTFNIGTGFYGNVYSLAIQSDGKIVVGGKFTSYNGTVRNRIARLNTDGSIDNTFNIGTGFNDEVRSLAIQSDGKIIVGGVFSSYNGPIRNCIVRLNTNGSIDNTFNIGTGFIGDVRTLAIQSDGKIIVGGWFTYFNGNSRRSIVRLNTDGSLDNTFNIGAGFNSAVNSLAIQSDGKIIVGGQFMSYNGTNRNRIARLNTGGSIDNTFNIGSGFDSTVNSLAIQSDGKIIVGGSFASYYVTTRNRIARLNSDGSIDNSYNIGTGYNSAVNSLAIQSDGKIIAGGEFTFYNGTIRNYLANLNTDGSIDNTFNIGTGFNSTVNSLAIQSDGKIIVGGQFTSYNGTAQSRIARLNTDGSIDNTFNIGTGFDFFVYSLAIQSDGKIIVGGGFTYFNGTGRNYITRINTDGSIDTTFNIGTGFNAEVWSLAIQSDGKIVVGGKFTSYNGTVRNRIARLNTDGRIDNTFNVGIGLDNTVLSIAIQSDAKIIVGGWFTSYNGTGQNYIARLNKDGSIDSDFNIGTGFDYIVLSLEIQSDGKIIVGGAFTSFNSTAQSRIVRLNTDGRIDNNFNIGTGFNNTVRSLAIQSNGKIIVGGWFTSYNGTGRNRIARLLNLDGLGIVLMNDSKHIKAYPNPVSNELIIEFDDNSEKFNFEIFNAIGQIILKGNLVGKTTIQTSNFTPGVYMIKLENGKFFEFKKIIKK